VFSALLNRPGRLSYPIIPYPTGRFFRGTLSQALRARLRSVSSLRDALADISQQHLVKACCELSRRDGAIVAWHEVPGSECPIDGRLWSGDVGLPDPDPDEVRWARKSRSVSTGAHNGSREGDVLDAHRQSQCSVRSPGKKHLTSTRSPTRSFRQLARLPSISARSLGTEGVSRSSS
jgi:hypothetical protein